MSDVKDKSTVVLWTAISCACLIALMGFGPRSAMGFFQLPILQDTGLALVHCFPHILFQ